MLHYILKFLPDASILVIVLCSIMYGGNMYGWCIVWHSCALTCRYREWHIWNGSSGQV